MRIAVGFDKNFGGVANFFGVFKAPNPPFEVREQ
jgi:hypothetical protein